MSTVIVCGEKDRLTAVSSEFFAVRFSVIDKDRVLHREVFLVRSQTEAIERRVVEELPQPPDLTDVRGLTPSRRGDDEPVIGVLREGVDKIHQFFGPGVLLELLPERCVAVDGVPELIDVHRPVHALRLTDSERHVPCTDRPVVPHLLDSDSVESTRTTYEV